MLALTAELNALRKEIAQAADEIAAVKRRLAECLAAGVDILGVGSHLQRLECAQASRVNLLKVLCV
jgi:hypothetical protein